jgi:hypothetical protein
MMNYKGKLLKKHLSNDKTNKHDMKGGGAYNGTNLLRGKEEEERVR